MPAAGPADLGGSTYHRLVKHRQGQRRRSSLRIVAPLAAGALVVSAGAGFALGLSAPQPQPIAASGPGAFTSWLEASGEQSIEQITTAIADHQLQRRGTSVLGASAALSGVPFTSLDLRLAKSSGPSADDARQGRFTTQAIVEYQLKVDGVRVGRRADAVFRLGEDGWRLVRVSPSGLDLWDHEAVQTQRSGRVLVIGSSGDLRIGGLAALAEQARSDVAQFWSSQWPGTAVVVLPSTADLLDPLLGTGAGSDQVAVTRWESGLDGPVIRVLLNPTYYDQMPPLAREIVLRHEITHVAQDALPQGNTPTWLSEGLAEYVGYRGAGVAQVFIAAKLFEQVRTSGAPDDLPDNSAFDFSKSQRERRVAYESGWAFCQMLADNYGADTLVPFYVAVAKGEGTQEDRLDDAAQDVFDTSFDSLRSQWRSWLEANA